MCDFSTDFDNFNSTSVNVTAESENAKALLAELFGKGAVSFNLKKSDFQRFADFANEKGLTVH